MRPILLIAHRWAGLTIALALVVTGLTGAILPFQDELRGILAPGVWNAEAPEPAARPLSGLEIKQIVERETGGTISYIKLAPDADHTQSVFISPAADDPQAEFRQLFVDPYTGEIRARVRFADLRDGAINWMPFLVSVHYSLAAGQWGRLILGIAALIWVGVSLIGIVLSLPSRNGKTVRETLKHWAPAWAIRHRQGSQAFTYDLHRASGLWLWPAMLVFAWSAVAFNLDAVHEPVQRFFGAQGLYEQIENPSPTPGEPMTDRQAVETGERLMRAEAIRQGFAIRGPEALSLRPYANMIGYYARTSLDGPTDNGSTVIWFDQVSGRPVAFRGPFGATPADAVDKTVRMLHTADLFGWPYKVFVSLFGLLTAATSIAGVILWQRRAFRAKRKDQRSTRSDALETGAC